MEHKFVNGAIVASGKLYESANYDVSNYVLSAQFNGCGGINYYSIADGSTFNIPIEFINISYNGKMQDMLLNKKVYMIGRKQITEIDLNNAAIIIEQFLDKNNHGIYTSYTLSTNNKNDVVQIGITGGFFWNDLCYTGKQLTNENQLFVSDSDFNYVPENNTVYLTLNNKTQKIRTRIIYCAEITNFDSSLENFDKICDIVQKEIEDVKIPANLNDTETALFQSSYWCALENYKEKGNYKAFMAGCRYLSPMRSYYRDSYFTVLSMYSNDLEKVKNQIITLATGIQNDGSCPSAVICDYSEWWGDHYDSPSFLAMMLYDYIHFSGDISFADFKVDDTTIFKKAVLSVEHLSKNTDDTGLLYKQGRYNKRDWADEVNRYGYVTYDEVLYARAIYCIAEIFKRKGEKEQYSKYIEHFENVKTAINKILWNEEKGYYINFKNEDYSENNLSIDTVFAAIYNIADCERAKRMLLKMEQMLETQNNGIDINFGSMCVYPFYSRIDSACHKSSQSFNYHNGANWPYLSAMYAYAKRKFHMNYKHLLTIPFEYNLSKGNYTPIEYFSPYCKDGSLLQAWSGAVAFVLDENLSNNFWE